ncbi:MAG: hypothetical protein IJ223_07545 [Clostridia bacterium]|nr:hypothetical protein [Clostridia bacterium]
MIHDNQVTGLMIWASIPSLMIANDLRLGVDILKLIIVLLVLLISFFGMKAINTEYEEIQDIWIGQFWYICFVMVICIILSETVLWLCNKDFLILFETIAESEWWNKIEIPFIAAYSTLAAYVLELKPKY